MKLTLNRKFRGSTYTIGDLSVNGKFFCNTIEDTVRELPAVCPNTPDGCSCTCKEKIYAKTAIPAWDIQSLSSVQSQIQEEDAVPARCAPFHRYPDSFCNTEVDSAGCIIVGNNTVKGKVLESRATFQKLYSILESETDITIQIV